MPPGPLRAPAPVPGGLQGHQAGPSWTPAYRPGDRRRPHTQVALLGAPELRSEARVKGADSQAKLLGPGGGTGDGRGRNSGIYRKRL